MESTSFPQCVHMSAAARDLAVEQGADVASMQVMPVSYVKGAFAGLVAILRRPAAVAHSAAQARAS